jgi:hypothetical protein
MGITLIFTGRDLREDEGKAHEPAGAYVERLEHGVLLRVGS